MVKVESYDIDAVMEFSRTSLSTQMGSFMLKGFSKRGYTTGSCDAKLTGIVPMMMDVLNSGNKKC